MTLNQSCGIRQLVTLSHDPLNPLISFLALLLSVKELLHRIIFLELLTKLLIYKAPSQALTKLFQDDNYLENQRNMAITTTSSNNRTQYIGLK